MNNLVEGYDARILRDLVDCSEGRCGPLLADDSMSEVGIEELRRVARDLGLDCVDLVVNSYDGNPASHSFFIKRALS